MSDAPPTLKQRLSAFAPTPVRRLLRGIATIPSRLDHARRRREAAGRVAGSGPIRSVLVLCHGNICRSPFVAHRLVERLGSRVAIGSGGFLRSGRPSPIEARTAAARRGIDLDEHRSRQVEAPDLEDADLIIVMEPAQHARVAAMAPVVASRVLVIGSLDPAPFQAPAVPDPWGQPAEEFDRCYERLDRCTAALVRLLTPTTDHP